MTTFWRPMTSADLPQVMAIADQVHVGYFESQAVFAERLALFAPGCLVAVQEGNESVLLGYAVMHPGRRAYPPALNSFLQRLAPQADALHLHDVAILAASRGSGLGRALVCRMHELMRDAGLAHATLVAVHGSAPYWRGVGFVEQAAQVPLGTYGEQAIYMARSDN